jgi:hypothetical protein
MFAVLDTDTPPPSLLRSYWNWFHAGTVALQVRTRGLRAAAGSVMCQHARRGAGLNETAENARTDSETREAAHCRRSKSPTPPSLRVVAGGCPCCEPIRRARTTARRLGRRLRTLTFT